MQRKIIQIADSTQLVSLPRKWAKKYNLKKGEVLDVQEEGNRIIVSAGKMQDEDMAIDLDVTELDKDSLIFFIRGLFNKGYEEIRLSFQKPKTNHHRMNNETRFLSVIHKEIYRSIGYEIISERGNSVVIKRISKSSMKDFDSMLKRIFLLIIDAANDLYDGLKKNDMELVRSVEDKHDSITKFIGYTQRILNSGQYLKIQDMAYLYHIISSLDITIDIFRNTARKIFDEKIRPSKQAIEILKEIVNAVEDYHDLFYNFSNTKCNEFSATRDKILHMISEKTPKLSKTDLRFLVALQHSIEVFRELFIARIAMEF